MDLIKTSQSDCYCYNQKSQVKWKYIWSTVQVKITSSGLLSIVYITERYNCQYPETILSIIKCVIHNFWTPKESNDITITINPYGETVCFSVKPARKIFIYTVSVNRNSYVLVVGCVSFTICYKHGPLVEERSRTLLAWTLQLLSLLLVYAGVAIPQVACAVMLLVLSSKVLHFPLRALAYVRWVARPSELSPEWHSRLTEQQEFEGAGFLCIWE